MVKPKEQMLYRQLAKYYDYVYSWKTYAHDVSVITKLINRHKRSQGNELLEVGCGTGNYLKYFSKGFSCTGIDISGSMLAIARKKLKGVRLVRGDMTNMRLGRKFDVVLCLWGVMSYAKDYAALQKTIENFSKHLKPGGVLIADPWYTTSHGRNGTKSHYKAGVPYMAVYDGPGLKISRMRIPINRGSRQVMDIHTLIAEKGAGKVKYFVDRYDVGLFEIGRTIQMLRKAGIKARFVRNSIGNGAYVGVKVE